MLQRGRPSLLGSLRGRSNKPHIALQQVSGQLQPGPLGKPRTPPPQRRTAAGGSRWQDGICHHGQLLGQRALSLLLKQPLQVVHLLLLGTLRATPGIVTPQGLECIQRWRLLGAPGRAACGLPMKPVECRLLWARLVVVLGGARYWPARHLAPALCLLLQPASSI